VEDRKAQIRGPWYTSPGFYYNPKRSEYLLLEVSGLRLISALSIILDAYNDKPDDQHIYLLKAIFHNKKHLFKGLALENKLSI
jgi:hypothetical protein